MSPRRPVRGERIWVLGASSGIGAALAAELAERGAKVAISARSVDKLHQVAEQAGSDVVTIPLDATDRAAVAAAWSDAQRLLGGVDSVVWSVGTWQQFDARDWDADAFATQIEVNLLGLNNVLAAVVPDFLAAHRGRVVGIASVAGFRGLPGAEAYGTTKAAQIFLLEALRGALTESGVDVMTVNPGFVATPMTADNTFPMPFIIEATDAGKTIADAMEAGRAQVTFPLPMALLMHAARVVPGRLWTRLTRRRTSSD